MPASPRRLKNRLCGPQAKRRRSARVRRSLAYHWLRAEAWDKALDYTLRSGGTGAEAPCSSRGD